MIFNIFASKKPVLSREDALQQQLQFLWKYQAALEKYFAEKVFDRTERKTLVINTLVKGAQLMTAPKYEEKGKTLNYLYGIARYELFDYYKKKKSKKQLSTVELLGNESIVDEPNYNLKKMAFIEECIEKAHCEVSTAKKDFVTAFEWHYFDRMPYKDIAIALKKPADYVEKKVGEIRNLIRDCALKKYKDADLDI